MRTSSDLRFFRFAGVSALLFCSLGFSAVSAYAQDAAEPVVKGAAATAFAAIDGSTQVYTHAYNFNNWPGMTPVNANGLIFTNAGGPANSAWPVIANWDSRDLPGGWTAIANRPADLSISFADATTAGSYIARNPDGVTPSDDYGRFLHGWIYNASGGARISTFTLSGLESGREYSLTLYYSLKASAATTTIDFISNETVIASTLDAPSTDYSEAYFITYNYTAGTDGTVAFTVDEPNGSFRLYGMTNLDVNAVIPEASTVALWLGATVFGACLVGRRIGCRGR